MYKFLTKMTKRLFKLFVIFPPLFFLSFYKEKENETLFFSKKR